MTRYTEKLALLALLSGSCIGACSDSATPGSSGAAITQPAAPSSVNPTMAPGGPAKPAAPSVATDQPKPAMPPGSAVGPGAMIGGAAAQPAMMPGAAASGVGGDGAGAAPASAGPDPNAKLEGACPEGYKIMPGFNKDFPSGGMMRAFYVVPPKDTTTPMPVWVPLTGTEESTQQNMEVLRSGNNKALADFGYMVLGPLRICANQNPMLTNSGCEGAAAQPYMYIPWEDGASQSQDISKPVYKEAGADSVFLEEMVRCVAASYPILKNKLYIGGISAGGSMTHRALTFNSKFWAGGMPISGEWRTSAKDGKVISGPQEETQMMGDPMGVFPGRTPPFPLPTLDPMVVITIRGGPNDSWTGTYYKPDAQAASNYYASQANVVSVVCMGNWGHQWPKDMGDANWTNLFNKWAVDLMASHPKGTPPSEFKLTDPPPGAGFSCHIGRFDSLYGK